MSQFGFSKDVESMNKDFSRTFSLARISSSPAIRVRLLLGNDYGRLFPVYFSCFDASLSLNSRGWGQAGCQELPVNRNRAVLSGDGRTGHFGLHGMRERAKLAGGELAIWSEVDSGTEIELTIPASQAYTTSARRFWWFRKPSQKDPDVKEKIES